MSCSRDDLSSEWDSLMVFMVHCAVLSNERDSSPETELVKEILLQMILDDNMVET